MLLNCGACKQNGPRIHCLLCHFNPKHPLHYWVLKTRELSELPDTDCFAVHVQEEGESDDVDEKDSKISIELFERFKLEDEKNQKTMLFLTKLYEKQAKILEDAENERLEHEQRAARLELKVKKEEQTAREKAEEEGRKRESERLSRKREREIDEARFISKQEEEQKEMTELEEAQKMFGQKKNE